MRAIDDNILYAQLDISMLAHPAEKMPSKDQLLNTFKDFPEIIATTTKLLAGCSFDFDVTIIRNKKHFTGKAYDDKLLLEKLLLVGMVRRYGKNNKEAKNRVIKELNIIDEVKISSYFLITNDIIRSAASRELLQRS